MERNGTKYARALFEISTNAECTRREWTEALQSYTDAVNKVAQDKKKPTLLLLDKYWQHQLRKDVLSRAPSSHLKLDELSKVMQWKLMRGKARPLQKLVDSNAPPLVISASTKAFDLVFRGHWQKAMEELCTLKGDCIMQYKYIYTYIYNIRGSGKGSCR